MFLWAKVPENIGGAEALSDHLLYKKNIFVTPGFVFGEKGRKYIRVSLCVPQELLKRVLDRLTLVDINKI